MRTGTGCTIQISTFGPPHNPSPSTERGKRRHGNREPSQRTHAERMWGKDRQLDAAKKWRRNVKG